MGVGLYGEHIRPLNPPGECGGIRNQSRFRSESTSTSVWFTAWEGHFVPSPSGGCDLLEGLLYCVLIRINKNRLVMRSYINAYFIMVSTLYLHNKKFIWIYIVYGKKYAEASLVQWLRL